VNLLFAHLHVLSAARVNTGLGGEDAGAKDPADLVRYAAQDDDIRHLGESGRLAVGGFREVYV